MTLIAYLPDRQGPAVLNVAWLTRQAWLSIKARHQRELATNPTPKRGADHFFFNRSRE